jgi:hypothetical protein
MESGSSLLKEWVSSAPVDVQTAAGRFSRTLQREVDDEQAARNGFFVSTNPSFGSARYKVRSLLRLASKSDATTFIED